MANDMRVKKIPITLDKERNLVFDLNTFAELEDIYGSHKAAMDVLKSGSFKAVRTFFWLGLVHEDESLTEKQVGALIGSSNIEELAEIIMVAVGANLPDAEKN